MTVDEVPTTDRLTPRLTRILWLIVLLVIAVTPLVVDPRGRDLFRVPKTAFFQAGMLVVGALAAAAALLSDAFAAALVRRRGAVMLACAGVAWVAVVSTTSIVPAVSASAPFTIFCYAVLFVVTIAVARSGNILTALGCLLAPAVVNAVIVVLQAFDVWQPFGISMPGADRLGNIGLIGNANTAGTYLLVPAVASFAAMATLRRYRIVFGMITVVLLAGIFEAQTITVMVGLTASLVALVASGSKRVRIIAIVVGVAGIAGVLLYPPTRTRLESLRAPLTNRDFGTVTSGRVPAAGVALQMFLERPLLGQGPGVFASRYMSRRIAIEEEQHPGWVQQSRENFGEAHNDHLQVLAESGLPGHLLFLFALGYVAWLTLRRVPAVTERGRFVRVFALPAAAGLGAVAVGQFPLELTAVMATCVFAAALCFAWSDDAVG
jgi:O-antigen ligase